MSEPTDHSRPNTVHIVPALNATSNLRRPYGPPHRTDSLECWCKPRVEPTTAEEDGVPLGWIVWHKEEDGGEPTPCD